MNVVNHFVPSGYAVYGFDQIGHGISAGERVYVEQFQDYTDTLEKCFDGIRESQPERPIFLLGHSMGALISATFLLEHQDELSGAVFSAPGIQAPSNTSQATVLVAKVLSIISPKAGLIRLDPNGLSRDPAVVDAYINDSLAYKGKITARLVTELL